MTIVLNLHPIVAEQTGVTLAASTCPRRRPWTMLWLFSALMPHERASFSSMGNEFRMMVTTCTMATASSSCPSRCG